MERRLERNFMNMRSNERLHAPFLSYPIASPGLQRTRVLVLV